MPARAVRALRRVAGEERSRQRDALPERRQRRDPTVRDRREPEAGQIAQRGLEARRSDHVVHRELERALRGRAVQDEPETAVPTLDALDHHVDHVGAGRAANVLLVGAQVAQPERRERERPDLDRPWRAEDDRARPGQEALRELEARVPLADDEDVAAGVALRRERVDVVRRVLEPGDLRPPRLRHPEREDGRAAAVLAVRRLQHEARAVVARRLPGAAVADAQRRTLREGREARLHLRPRRQVVGAVHQRRHERLQLRLVGQEAVVVVPLVLAGGPLGRRVGLRPGDQALVDREPPEHPARLLVAGNDGVLYAEAAQEVRGLKPAGAAADDDDVVVAGRRGPLYGCQSSVPRRRRASTRSRRSINCGRSRSRRSSCAPGITRQRSSETATTSVAGGSPVNAEISPKTSPRPRRISSSPPASTTASPSRMTKKSPLASPRRRTRSPSAKTLSSYDWAIASSCGGARSAKSEN